VVFIRRVRTTSGATAVQMVEYVDGRQRIVRHIGSAPSQAELGILGEKPPHAPGSPGDLPLTGGGARVSR
jgi:hypothetical protein